MNRVKFGGTPFGDNTERSPLRERVETLRRVPKTCTVTAKIKSGLQRRIRRLWQHRVVRKSLGVKTVPVRVRSAAPKRGRSVFARAFLAFFHMLPHARRAQGKIYRGAVFLKGGTFALQNAAADCIMCLWDASFCPERCLKSY